MELLSTSNKILSMISNVVSSVSLILINKRLVVQDEFNFMTILTGIHFYFSFVSCCIMLLIGLLQYKYVNNYMSIARISLGMLSSILFMNFNLSYNSVGFYQASKLACIPTTLLIESLLNKRHHDLTIILNISLLFIIIGVGLICVTEVSYTLTGVIWASLGILSTSLAQIFFSPLQKELNLNALQLLFHTSPW